MASVRRHPRRIAEDLFLVTLAALLVLAVVVDVAHRVELNHRLTVDKRAFKQYVASAGERDAFHRVTAHTGGRTDVVCGQRGHDGRRTAGSRLCLEIQAPHRPRI